MAVSREKVEKVTEKSTFRTLLSKIFQKSLLFKPTSEREIFVTFPLLLDTFLRIRSVNSNARKEGVLQKW